MTAAIAMDVTSSSPVPTFNGAPYDVELDFGALLDKHPD